ncbi:MAG TPA: ABC transporter permease [Gammaproteobacteria bacterium]|nr:ABC transporter permease [Gammaproteobacteria bacterium]
MSTFLADLRYGARGLRARPAFVAVIVLTLALGIGANVAIVSLFQQILLSPLPVPDPERLVNLSDPGPKPGGLTFGSIAGGRDSTFSYPMFRDLERAEGGFLRIAAHRLFDASVSTGDAARRETGLFVSGSYFSVLGLEPALGRLLGLEDDRVDGQAASVVLSHAYWESGFGADPGILGRKLIVNGAPLTIVGVAKAGFRGTTLGARASVFVPMTFRGVDSPTSIPNHENRLFYWVYLFARLEPGVSRDAAAAAVNARYRAILNDVDAPLQTGASDQELEAFRKKSLVLEPGERGQSSLLPRLTGRLEMLLGVSGAVLLLCCANVAGLMLVRGSARTGEMAVRASMGATRGRLASLLLAESLLPTLPAALLSWPVAWLTLRGLASGVPGIPAGAFDADVSFAAALAAIGAAVLTALAFGLFPALRLVRAEPRETLQAYGTRQTSGKAVQGFRTALATVQIALSMALLALTGVFAQSLANIARIDLGFDVDSVVTFSISPETNGYSPERSARLFDRLDQELAAIPGVDSAASSMVGLLSGNALTITTTADAVEGRPRRSSNFDYVSPGFFRTLGIPLLAGRDFSGADAAGAPAAAIVNERFAERFGLGRDVIGRRISPGPLDAEIVGLVADAKYASVTEDVAPQLYVPRRQSTTLGSSTFYVRGARPPEDLIAAVRETVARIDPAVPITDVHTMREQLRESIALPRFAARAATAFAVLATVLAGLGLYGVLAYSVAQRSREIGLRVALGAPAGRIRGMVVRQVVAMTSIGGVVGAVAAVLLARAARSVLYEIGAGDPVAVAAAAAVVAAVTLGAAYLPARRASRVDPMVALRYE